VISQESLERERALGRARRSGGGYGGTPQGFLAAPLVAPAWLLTSVHCRPTPRAQLPMAVGTGSRLHQPWHAIWLWHGDWPVQMWTTCVVAQQLSGTV